MKNFIQNFIHNSIKIIEISINLNILLNFTYFTELVYLIFNNIQITCL